MADQTIDNMSVTWNSGGTTFTAVKMNVTDTASAIASLLVDFQVGGTSKWSVKKDGSFTAAAGATIGGNSTITGTLGVTGAFSAAAITGTTMSGTNLAASGTVIAQGNIGSEASVYSDLGGIGVFGSNTNGGSMRLRPNGIGSATNQATLTTGGDLTVAGDLAGNSDRKLKKHVKRITGALSMVRRMRGVYYTLRRGNTKHVGVIAQEVEPIVPEVVSDNEGTKAVAYGNLVGVLIEAVKELADKVEALEAAK